MTKSQHLEFQSTHWSLIQRVGLDSEAAREALDSLCQGYWFPLYAFLRQRGVARATAEDQVQGFFVYLFEKQVLQQADQSRGRFRNYLLTCFKNFLHNEHTKATAQKRGGHRKALSLDFSQAEKRYCIEPSHQLTAEKLFERAWTKSLLARVIGRLREHYLRKNQQELFDSLKVALTVAQPQQISSWAKKFQRSPGSIRVILSRMRQKFREFLELEIANTLDMNTLQSQQDIEGEIQVLFQTLENS